MEKLEKKETALQIKTNNRMITLETSPQQNGHTARSNRENEYRMSLWARKSNQYGNFVDGTTIGF